MNSSTSSASSSEIIRPGTRVRLPDGTTATVRAREVGGATYVVDVNGTLHRGWTREQLSEAESATQRIPVGAPFVARLAPVHMPVATDLVAAAAVTQRIAVVP